MYKVKNRHWIPAMIQAHTITLVIVVLVLVTIVVVPVVVVLEVVAKMY